MLLARNKLSLLCSFAGFSAAYPSLHQANPRAVASQAYVAPGPGDARAPCPALNTLANHGYINHDGKDIERQDIIDAFLDQFGIMESAIDTALTNAFVVCEYVTGADCNTTLTNLTLLAEPHAFEHDHSFSRQDYMMAWLPMDVAYSDNQNFNASIFETSLDVLNGSTHVDYQQMNEIRLEREALSLNDTRPGWFLEAKSIQEFEAGFIFAVMGDFDLPNYNTTPTIRVEWWQYWFTNESFPYELGWHPPTSARGVDFVLSASSEVLAAQVTSTPYPLVSGAVGPAAPPGTLSEAGATTTYQIPTFAPYAAAGVGANDKRDVSTAFATATAFPVLNPYVHTLDPAAIAAQQAIATSQMSAMATQGA